MKIKHLRALFIISLAILICSQLIIINAFATTKYLESRHKFYGNKEYIFDHSEVEDIFFGDNMTLPFEYSGSYYSGFTIFDNTLVMLGYLTNGSSGFVILETTFNTNLTEIVSYKIRQFPLIDYRNSHYKDLTSNGSHYWTIQTMGSSYSNDSIVSKQYLICFTFEQGILYNKTIPNIDVQSYDPTDQGEDYWRESIRLYQDKIIFLEIHLYTKIDSDGAKVSTRDFYINFYDSSSLNIIGKSKLDYNDLKSFDIDDEGVVWLRYQYNPIGGVDGSNQNRYQTIVYSSHGYLVDENNSISNANLDGTIFMIPSFPEPTNTSIINRKYLSINGTYREISSPRISSVTPKFAIALFTTYDSLDEVVGFRIYHFKEMIEIRPVYEINLWLFFTLLSSIFLVISGSFYLFNVKNPQFTNLNENPVNKTKEQPISDPNQKNNLPVEGSQAQQEISDIVPFFSPHLKYSSILFAIIPLIRIAYALLFSHFGLFGYLALNIFGYTIVAVFFYHLIQFSNGNEGQITEKTNFFTYIVLLIYLFCETVLSYFLLTFHFSQEINIYYEFNRAKYLFVTQFSFMLILLCCSILYFLLVSDVNKRLNSKLRKLNLKESSGLLRIAILNIVATILFVLAMFILLFLEEPIELESYQFFKAILFFSASLLVTGILLLLIIPVIQLYFGFSIYNRTKRIKDSKQGKLNQII